MSSYLAQMSTKLGMGPPPSFQTDLSMLAIDDEEDGEGTHDDSFNPPPDHHPSPGSSLNPLSPTPPPSGKDATEEFEDAGHSKSARELLEKFCTGELDTPTPLIPQLEIVKQQQENLRQKLMELTKRYRSTVSVAVVGVAIIVSVFYLRSRK